MPGTSPGGIQAQRKLRVQPRAGSERPEQGPQPGPRRNARHVRSACRGHCARQGKSSAGPQRAHAQESGFAAKLILASTGSGPFRAFIDAAIDAQLRWRRLRTVDAFDASPHDSDRLPSRRV